MVEFGLREMAELARGLEAVPDERPEWLKGLDTDPTSVYYRYFFELGRRRRSHVVFEIGTCEGKSAAHLAAGNPEGLVITLDVKPGAKALADSLLIPNLVALVCDSMEIPERLRWMPSIDLLFIDGDHNLQQAYGEYLRYRPFVRDGGLILFDDIRISPEMELMWRSVADPKAELGALHYTGFGVAVKDPAARPLAFEAVLAGLRQLDSRNEVRSLR